MTAFYRGTGLNSEQIGAISKALGDPKRFELLQRIADAEEPPTCACICGWLDLSPATVSHHLKELQEAGLVEVEREGKFARVSLKRDVVKAYANHLARLGGRKKGIKNG